MAVHGCNSSTWKVRTGRTGIQGQLGLQRYCLKRTKHSNRNSCKKNWLVQCLYFVYLQWFRKETIVPLHVRKYVLCVCWSKDIFASSSKVVAIPYYEILSRLIKLPLFFYIFMVLRVGSKALRMHGEALYHWGTIPPNQSKVKFRFFSFSAFWSWPWMILVIWCWLLAFLQRKMALGRTWCWCIRKHHSSVTGSADLTSKLA